MTFANRIQELGKVKIFELEHTRRFEEIPLVVISSFSILQVLRMKGCDSFVEDCEDLIKELENLKYINNLSIPIRSDSALQRFIRY